VAINFPNPARSYEPARNCVRFWGHDRAMEVVFFLDEDAIFKIAPQTVRGEPGILKAFDLARDRIQAVAARVYAASRGRHSFPLVAADF